MQLPIGWTAGWETIGRQSIPYSAPWWKNIAVALFGWLMTALAATMGAPFWFDLLNRVMVIRSTVKPHEKSPEEASQDHQRPTPQGGTTNVSDDGGTTPQETIRITTGRIVAGMAAPLDPGVDDRWDDEVRR
jgi:hypothetical protein